MTETTQSPESTASPYADPAAFHAMIGKIQAGEPVQSAAPAEGESVSSESIQHDLPAETPAEEQSKPDESEEPQEEAAPEPELPAKGGIPLNRHQKMLRDREAQIENERRRAEDAERRYQELMDAVQKFGGKPEKEATKDDFQPLDEEAWQRTEKGLGKAEEAIKKAESAEEKVERFLFQSTLQMQEATARVQHPDFDDAYRHYCEVEISRAKAFLGNEEQAEQAAAIAVARAAQMAYQRGENVAEMFYNLAQQSGYRKAGMAAPAKKGPNLDAIEANSRKSPPAYTSTSAPAAGNASGYSHDGLRMDNGLYDPNKFNAMIQRVREKGMR